MLKPDCQGESRSVRTYSIARHHEAGMKATSRFCDGDQFMAKQDTNRRDDNAEPLRLHTRRTLDDAGVPAMTRAMEAHLCQPHERIERPGDLPAPLGLPAAWARLQAQEPPLARAVAATVMQGLSPRKAAPSLGFCFKTVATDRAAGMAQLQVWTGLPSDEVARQLRDLDSLHAA